MLEHTPTDTGMKSQVHLINNPWGMKKTRTYQHINTYCGFRMFQINVIYLFLADTTVRLPSTAFIHMMIHYCCIAHHAVARQPHSGAEHYGILLGNVLIMSTLGHLWGSVYKELYLLKHTNSPFSHSANIPSICSWFSGRYDQRLAFTLGENGVFAGLADWCTHIIVTDSWISQMLRPVTHAVHHQRSIRPLKRCHCEKLAPSFTQFR